MNVIEIENLYFRYHGSEEYALKNINLVIKEGEFIVLSGPSGCGKTTLLRTFNGLIPHFYKGDMKGSVKVWGLNTLEHETYELAKYVGLVFQDPESQMLTLSVEREIAFGPENLGLDRNEIFRRVEWALEAVDIEKLRNVSPNELSGGEKQKVAIAAVMALKPKILALDEPLSNLDPASSLSIVKLLSELNEKYRITIVVSEHRLDLLAPLADRIILMDKGEILIIGKPSEVLSSEIPEKIGIGIPQVIEIWKRLREKNIIKEVKPFLTVADASKFLVRVIENGYRNRSS